MRSRFVPTSLDLPPSTVIVGDAPISPAAWFYDWSRSSPLDSPSVEHWLRGRLSTVLLPAGWLRVSFSTATPLDPLAAEDSALDAVFTSLTAGSKAVGTLSKYRVPFLKMMLWMALRGKSVAPPLAVDVGRYMSAILIDRRNKSCCEVTSSALSFVCWLNAWPSISTLPACTVPSSAGRRAFSEPTKKAAPLESWMVAAIAQACCSVGSPDHLFMFGTAVTLSFMILCRYDDLKRLRWDDGYFEDHSSFIRFFLEKRKTDQNYAGVWIDIPFNPPSDDSFGISAVVLARAMRLRAGGVGSVLRRISSAGQLGPHLGEPFFEPSHPLAGNPRWMSLSDLVALLRAHLISDCGLSAEEASVFSGHSARAGGTTELVLQQVPESIIKELAGVVGVNWIATYDRKSLDRRLAALRNFGF